MEAVKRALAECNDRLVSELDLNVTFISSLVARGAINPVTKELLTQEKNSYTRVDILLDKLTKSEVYCFEAFLEILWKNNKDLAKEVSKKWKEPSGASVDDKGKPYTPSVPQEPILFDVGALPPLNVKVEPGTKAFFDEKIKETPYKVNPDKCRGRAYIINIFKVEREKDRIGTDVDRDNLKTLFKKLQFDVRAFDDSDGLSADDIKQKIKRMAGREEKINDAQCFVLCILSHGGTYKDEKCPENNKGFFYGTDGGKVLNDEVFTQFSDQQCQALRGKPRLIFFQACRDYTVDHRDGDKKFDDFLVGYPTLEGESAYRNKWGSYYMRQIVEVFMKNAWNTDVSTMMTMVKNAVTQQKTCMIPETVDGLTGKFYFFPQEDEF